MKWRTLPVGLAAALGLAAAPPSPLEVRPGAIVRWAGEGLETCWMHGERWEPLDDACYFPVDLLASGTVEVARRRSGVLETRRLRVGRFPYAEQRVAIADERKVSPNAQDLKRIRAEQARVGALWKLDGPRRFALPLQPPLADLPAGGRFGARRIFNGQPRSPHSGADYVARAGTPVGAAAAGRVALAEDQFFAGKAVYLDHGDGLITMYFHLSELAVEAGAEVAAGQTIGRVGATGRASGPHLHFAARWRGARVDPALLLAPEAAPELR